jgi:hypothetical protein
MACLFLYAALSFRHAALLSINNQIFYTVIVGFIVVEVALRIVPSLVPDEIVHLLPEADRKTVASRRGLFTEEALTGKGMLFYWKPQTTISKKPWIKIDANGFRNRTNPKGRTDVVILGASVSLAGDVPFDLSDRFIQSGQSAYSLAMGSYAPQHYRDSYRRFVIERGIKHKAVIVLIIPIYDLEKAIYYERIAKSSGDYRKFLRPAPILDHGLPILDALWTPSILNGLPTKIAHKLHDSLLSNTIPITLDWKTIHVPENVFYPKHRPPGWAPFTKAITQIIGDARNAGAVPFVVLYPGIAARLAPYAKLKNSVSTEFKKYVETESARIAKIVKRAEGEFINVTAKFQLRSRIQELTQTPMDLHLNQAGIDLLYEAIKPEVSKALAQ